MATDKFLTGISIAHEEKAIVDSFKEKIGIRSFSSTLGIIIREWAQMKQERARLLSTRLDPRDPYWLTEAGKEQSR